MKTDRLPHGYHYYRNVEGPLNPKAELAARCGVATVAASAPPRIAWFEEVPQGAIHTGYDFARPEWIGGMFDSVTPGWISLRFDLSPGDTFHAACHETAHFLGFTSEALAESRAASHCAEVGNRCGWCQTTTQELDFVALAAVLSRSTPARSSARQSAAPLDIVQMVGTLSGRAALEAIENAAARGWSVDLGDGRGPLDATLVAAALEREAQKPKEQRATAWHPFALERNVIS